MKNEIEQEKAASRQGVARKKNGDGNGSVAVPGGTVPGSVEITSLQPGSDKVIRRNGKSTPFDKSKIVVAMTKAFLEVEGGQAAASTRVREKVEQLSTRVVEGLARHLGRGAVHIEDIQDQVELALMRTGEHKVARAYVIYREEHARKREAEAKKPGKHPVLPLVRGADGKQRRLDKKRLLVIIKEACQDLPNVAPEQVLAESLRAIYDGIAESEIGPALVMSARTLVEQEPNYSQVAAGLLLHCLRREVLSHLEGETREPCQAELAKEYPDYFQKYIETGVKFGLLEERLGEMNLRKLGQALRPQRDLQFSYLGLQTLYDRYFIHHEGNRLELPQAFFMRVAMGLALNEPECEQHAIAFYELLSSFRFMSSTPTLFNAGTRRPQLSSCFLTTVADDLKSIYDAIRDDALLSKFAGGLGNDWSSVRAMGAHIRGTNGKSQGIVPFLKVVNDTAVAVNQGGKRKGAVCSYLEIWHLDIEEFLELRKNTGDDRRRTHDMNTANWIPDLFMKRVCQEGNWTLFSPDETPDLHDLYGQAFERRYHEYEERAKSGELRNFKTLLACDLWRKMLSMLYETGHPWLTFKDPCNLRSPQRHAGVVHSSNLCTEITLNTSNEEIAVCNLGSVNLVQHMQGGELQQEALRGTLRTAMRMLDNVIDLNYYTVPQARRSNLRHRPVGLGLMGFQDALYELRIPYASQEAVEFADQCMEVISYYTIDASCELARERGAYQSFKGSLWDQGILPLDSIAFLEQEREGYLRMDRSKTLDWDSLRKKLKDTGIRNSNCMAIAPTATISNICGVTQSIEPTYQNLYVKSNLSGEFTVINPYLVRDLKQRKLWDEVMVNDLKYYNGSVQSIERIPEELKQLYATAFELDPRWLVEAASRRQKWLDQAQSLNLYLAEPNGKKLDNLYKLAWLSGLKTTYYLRSMGATRVEKSTLKETRDSPLNQVSLPDPAPSQTHSQAKPPGQKSPGQKSPVQQVQACYLDDPECEACQ